MKNEKNNKAENSSADGSMPEDAKNKMPELDKIELVPGNDADVTKEDLEALGPKDLSMDMGDDEDLKHRVHPVDFTGKDLDVPGAELDDVQEKKGSEDEENNSYSIGGDAHDNLEETNNI
ncbi:MAG: hypothetical protein JWO44_509 [Bacteroidetes bacterium]|nr:hypothetical protein [Bacteroidota bacterium]